MVLRAVDIRYSVEGREILKGVSVEVKGGITAILGPNGAGKTTLLKCIVGILSPQEGEIFYCSLDLTSLPQVERAKIISYVPQELPRTFPYTAFEMVLMGRNPHVNLLKGPTEEDEKEAEKALETLGILCLRDRYYNSLSGGEKRLVLIARALAQGGKVLVMDEPTSFLDYGNQVKVMKLCSELSRRLKRPILISIHDPNLALRYCDYVYLMSEGEIVEEGEPEEVIRPETLFKVYGVKAVVLEKGGHKYVVAEGRTLTLRVPFKILLASGGWRMRIVVLVKPVPDINRVRFDAERGRVIREGVPLEENPFDLHALELALQIKDSIGAEVIALGMAPPQGERALRDCIARGADKAILLSDVAFAGSDTFATSLALSNAIRKIGKVNLVICGEKTTDGDTGQVGPEVASMLSLPFLPNLCELKEISEERISGICDLGDKYLAEVSLPAVISVKKELNVPRLPTLRGKVRSFEGRIEVWSASDIGGGPYGLEGSKTSVIKVRIPKEEGRKGEVLNIREGVRVLLSLLSELRGRE